MPCTLTFRYFNNVKKNLRACDSSGWLSESIVDHLDELFASYDGMDGSAASQKLRAFYCLEVLYHLILPGSLVTAGISPSKYILISRVIPRTWVGLDQLIDVLAQIDKDTTITSTELAIRGVKDSSVRADASAVQLVQRNMVAHLTKKITRLAKQLRAELPNDNVDLEVVGGMFADILHDVGESSMQLVHHAHNLINISAENSISPCLKHPV